MTSKLIEITQRIVAGLYEVSDIKPEFTFTKDLTNGDLTTNIAMILAKRVGKAPHIIAAEIAEALTNEPDEEFRQSVTKIEAVNGFVNVYLSAEKLYDTLLKITPTYGNNQTEQAKRIMVEYGDPNTHKLPHIGHLFSYIVGESFARLLTANGNTVMKANYQGDIGPHVAKALYGYIQRGCPKPDGLRERAELLQLCYQEGATAYEEDETAKETITDINKKIYLKDPEIYPIYLETRQWCVDFYKTFEDRLDIHQTYHYWESEIWERGKKIVEDNIGTVFQVSQGAVIFPGSKFGLHDRVFLTKNNTPTYEAKDMGLNIQKYEDWKFDSEIITTANEQNAYFDVIIEALGQCFPELKGKVKHVGFGMVSLSTGKMSSRTGNILSAVGLLDEIQKRVEEVMKDRKELSTEEKKSIIEQVTMAAVKFAFLKQNILLDMKFDIDESVTFEGKSGPYVQYTYARIQSVLRQNIDLPQATSEDVKTLVEPEEVKLLRVLYRYPTVVKQAAELLAPHLIAEFVYQIAQEFTTFYTKHSINSAKTEEVKRARRMIAERTALVLKHGLNLLGIEVVPQM